MSQRDCPLTTELVLVTNPTFVLREEDDDASLLFDPETGAVRIMNPTAVAVWKRLDGKRSLTQIITDLREEFEGVDATAETQVDELLKHLLAIGAVGTVAESSA